MGVRPIDLGLLVGLPPTLVAHAHEPTFSPADTSYVGWSERGGIWRRWSVELPGGDDPDGSEGSIAAVPLIADSYVVFSEREPA